MSAEENVVHVPVLLQEVLRALQPRDQGVYLDGTLGGGGHTEAILQASAPQGRVIGLDLDPHAVARCRQRFQEYGDRFTAIHAGFHETRRALASVGVERLDGALLDLGLSSDQLEDPARGFGFLVEGPLDMRFDTTKGETTLDLLHRLSVKELEEILATYGEERYCKKLAWAIFQAREQGLLKTTKDLRGLVSKTLGSKRGKIHPATRTFQALRIAVNRELEHLETALEEIPPVLKPGGRFCVIAYHSLEDRAVKRSFARRIQDSADWTVLTRRPVRPSYEEIRTNRRARSARMRVLEALTS